jgi:6-pyruvoyltetrahydropterin/6-carboxytetrahydropterin synthase
MHGYAIQVEVEFRATELDQKNWVVDFGGLKQFKGWLEDMFDHKTLVARDDPELGWFQEGQRRGNVDLKVVEGVGCEAFSYMIFNWLNTWVDLQPEYKGRVEVFRVEVREHGGNSAFTEAMVSKEKPLAFR